MDGKKAEIDQNGPSLNQNDLKLHVLTKKSAEMTCFDPKMTSSDRFLRHFKKIILQENGEASGSENKLCRDVDECALEGNVCGSDQNTFCENIDGSYSAFFHENSKILKNMKT